VILSLGDIPQFADKSVSASKQLAYKRWTNLAVVKDEAEGSGGRLKRREGVRGFFDPPKGQFGGGSRDRLHALLALSPSSIGSITWGGLVVFVSRSEDGSDGVGSRVVIYVIRSDQANHQQNSFSHTVRSLTMRNQEAGRW
jgi:hypothetical protein